jgi:hypothetical protein
MADNSNESKESNDLEPLFTFMGKNLEQFETHIESSLPNLPSEEVLGVSDNFAELRMILENSVYAAFPVTQPKISFSKKIRSIFS